MTFLVSKRARRHIEAIQAWWAKHRPSAPGMFLDELSQVERLLRDNPTFGVVYAVDEGKGSVRRILLARTRKHLYYRHRPDRDEVLVLAVWGAPRARAPKV